MKVASILKSKGGRVVTMRPDASITSVIQRMKLERIGAIVISADGERIDGIVSERDIVYGLADQHRDLLALKVSDVMTRDVITCTPDDQIKQVMARMTHSRVRHVPVLDDGRLHGIVSIGDVVKNRLEEVELEATVLRDAYIAVR
jgi:CBS domain-containing protein